jgi:hypothetical protein
VSLPADWRTLRELDLAAGAAKGSAFRIFRALADELREHHDYEVFSAGAEYEALRASSRGYATSVRMIVLGPAAAERVLAALRQAR